MSWLLLWTIVDWTIRVVMVVVILRRRALPVVSLAWLAIVFAVPTLGLLLYLMLGVSYFTTRRRRRSHRAALGQGPGRARGRAHDPGRLSIGEAHLNMIKQAQQVSGNPIVGGNRLDLIADNDRFIDSLVADIDRAERHVHLLYYIYRPDSIGRRVTDAVLRANGRGVTCRMLIDSAGSWPFWRSRVDSELLAAGVQLVPMLPVAPWRRRLARIDLRNHRKIAVIDGRVAYCGSHNVVDETHGNRWAGRWVDLSGRFTGPIVSQLQSVFLDDWHFETRERLEENEDLFPQHDTTGPIAAQVVPTGPNHEAETFRRVLIAALNAAREQIVITTPYLIPDEPTLLALSMAADRGVKVTLLVPRRSDQPLVAAAGRWYFDRLLDAGIGIHHYCDGMLHSKTITVDHSFALLGSANLDIRSFALNFEVNVLLYGRDVTDLLRFAQQQYLKQCVPITAKEWAKRHPFSRYRDAAAALLSPLL